MKTADRNLKIFTENIEEETIKQLELILKARKEHKEIIECAGGWCVNCDPDIKALTESIDILKDYKKVLKEVKRLENMYEAEKRIHMVRNEQLARKQQLVIKCNELENVNKELKEEIKSWKKYSDEQEENIIEKNNIICNLEFQREKQQKEIEEKDKIINVMAEYISKKEILVDKHCYALTAEAVKQWFEKQIK